MNVWGQRECVRVAGPGRAVLRSAGREGDETGGRARRERWDPKPDADFMGFCVRVGGRKGWGPIEDRIDTGET